MSCQFWGRARLLVERPYRNLLIALSGGWAIVGRRGRGRGTEVRGNISTALSHIGLLLSLEYLSLTQSIRVITNACYLFIYSYNITWI